MFVPDACTLPIAERPRRLAELGDLVLGALRRVERIDPLCIRLTLTGRDGDDVLVDIGVPAAERDVVEDLYARLTAAVGARR